VLDSTDTDIESIFRRQVSILRSFLMTDLQYERRWHIEFWCRAKQLELLGRYAQKHRNFFVDSGSGRFGGVRAIQNVSQAIADSLTPIRDGVVIHRFDDDIFPYALDCDNKGNYTIEKVVNIFCRKRLSLMEHDARIVGSYYTLDSPSLITDLFEVAECLDTLTAAIDPVAARSNSYDWKSIAHSIYVYGAPNMFSCNNVEPRIRALIRGAHIQRTESLADVLTWVDSSLLLFELGVNCFEYNLHRFATESGWFGPRNSLPGGCVSHWLEAPMAPFPNFGDQDMLWSFNEHLSRGGVVGDFSVLHVKSPAGRLGLIHTLESQNEEHVRASFSITVTMQKLILDHHGTATTVPDIQKLGGFGPHAVERSKVQLLRVVKRLQRLLDQLDESAAGAIDVLPRTIGKIEKILAGYSVIERTYCNESIVTPTIKQQVEEWMDSERAWNDFRKMLRPHRARRSAPSSSQL
jgi:hypothetical protein